MGSTPAGITLRFPAGAFFVLLDVPSNTANVIVVENQLQEDQITDQISLKEFVDPFMGSKNTKA